MSIGARARARSADMESTQAANSACSLPRVQADGMLKATLAQVEKEGLDDNEEKNPDL